MATKLNTEFNYRYQVQGETVWEKIKTIKGFLDGRIRAAALDKVSALKIEAKREKLKWMQEQNIPRHEQLELEAELIELESHEPALREALDLNRQEISFLKSYLAELYTEAEPTRISGYTDEQMFEANAALEFTVWIAKEIQAEIIATGRPSPAKLRNAMSNPMSFDALKQVGLIPADAALITGGICADETIKLEVTDESLRIESE